MADHGNGRAECSCSGGASRREFLVGLAAAGLAGLPRSAPAADAGQRPERAKQGARVRAVFIYPPSKTFASDPEGWWSWPGNEFDAEGRQARYTAAFQSMARRLRMEISVDERPVASEADARRVAGELRAAPPDGLLAVLFYNRAMAEADLLLRTAEELSVPAVFYIGLGVKHGPVAQYRRPGVYLIESLENLEAIEYGLRMIQTRKLLRQSLLLSFVEADRPSEKIEPFLGVTIRVIPFARYADEFRKVSMNREAKAFIESWRGPAQEVRGVTGEAFENAARAYVALRKIVAEEGADGVTMNCLRRGMLKPCMAFARLNSGLVPAACENDQPAALTQMLGQLLTGRPGFQHNPAFETERNHYYASHCTCPTKVYGPGGPELPYLLRRFAHTNEGSCAIQVFFNPGDPVTMVRYYPGDEPALDVYAGRVVRSHPMPPAAGCTTNVEIEITDRPDACMVKGHHNLIFCGDYARRFRLFAQLHRMRLADTGYAGPWPL